MSTKKKTETKTTSVIPQIKKTVEPVPVGNVTYDREEELKRVFKLFDKDGNGTISFDEVTSLLKSLGKNPTEEEIKKLIEETDKDKSGSIELGEFINYMNSIYVTPESKLEEVVEAFQIFDRDGNGWVSYDEFK